MKETYKFLSIFLPFVAVGSFLTTAMGCVAFSLGYNPKTSWLYLHGACTIIFAIFGFATMCYAGFVAYKANNISIKKIRRNYGFLRVSSIISFCVILFVFGADLVKLILASYSDTYSTYFTTWRLFKFIFAFPCSLHFLLMALPTKYKRKKISIPKPLLYITSTSTVLWAVFGLLAAYFSKQLTTMNILKIWQIVVYLVFTIFFLFEIKFEHISQNPKSLIFTGCLSFIFAMAFSLSTLISVIVGIVPASKSFSMVELMSSIVIGVYAFSRVFAIANTMKHVIRNTDSSSHSSKFDGNHHHHHHHHHHHSSDNTDNEGSASKATSEQ